jgi:hypothetical protein
MLPAAMAAGTDAAANCHRAAPASIGSASLRWWISSARPGDRLGSSASGCSPRIDSVIAVFGAARNEVAVVPVAIVAAIISSAHASASLQRNGLGVRLEGCSLAREKGNYGEGSEEDRGLTYFEPRTVALLCSHHGCLL